MTPAIGRSRRSARAILAALALILTLPASAFGAHGPHPNPATAYITFTPTVLALDDEEIVPLIDVEEDYHGVLFEGIPDGIGGVPISTDGDVEPEFVDLFVTHEQSRVPFDPPPPGSGGGPLARDLKDSSVTRWRVDVATQQIVDASVALPDSAGFIRFCSAFMAGPEHGFDDYTFLVNEESNDILPVPAGASYGADPALAPNRQAGYSVWLETSPPYDFAPISRLGRHNHENTVVIPGGWNNLAVLSGDDTFSPPQVNGSQLYLYTAKDDDGLMDDKGQLWAFQVTADGSGTPIDPYNPMNDANDYLDISMGEVFSGRFIHVPTDVARGLTGDAPQTALENWSNANNVFQFVRVEDVDYDPQDPTTVYFADTGSSVIGSDNATGRMTGLSGTSQQGRIFRMELNAKDPRIVDSFSILVDGANVLDLASPASNKTMRRPDNIDVGERSIMVQEDQTGGAKIWMYSFADETWTHVATTLSTQPLAETSGIVDASDWWGDGWWALDVQSHTNVTEFTDGDGVLNKREDGQLLLMYIPGS